MTRGVGSRSIRVGRMAAADTIRYTYRCAEGVPVDRTTFDNSLLMYKGRSPFQPFTVIMVRGDRLEVGHGGALGVRDGVALYVAPGGVPIAFDHEGVSHIIGDPASSRSTSGDA